MRTGPLQRKKYRRNWNALDSQNVFGEFYIITQFDLSVNSKRHFYENDKDHQGSDDTGLIAIEMRLVS